MSQIQEKIQKGTPEEEGKNPLLKKFLDKKNEVTTRVVTLSYKSCCGCGCDYLDIQRTVPADSPLKDGDRIEDLLPGDKSV